MRLARWAAWGPIAAPWVFTVLAVLATVLTPGHSIVGDAISLLAGPGSPYPWLLNTGIIAYAVLVQGLGPGLYRAVGGGRWGLTLWALVVCYGLGGAGAGVWQDAYTTPVWGPVDENALHDGTARAGFVAIFALTMLTPIPLRRRPGWVGWARFSWAMGVLSIAAALPFDLRVWTGIHGLLERAFFVTTMAWVLATGLGLRRG